MCFVDRQGEAGNARRAECGVKVPDLYSSGAKLIRVPKEAYLKSHPRNTLSSQASERFFAAEQTQRTPRNARALKKRGYFVLRTERLLPRSHRHKNSAGAAAHSAPNQEATASKTPPRPRNAQGHFERRRRRGPETHK